MAAGGAIAVTDAKKVIHEVVSTLQNNNERQRHGGLVSQIVISEVFKGGSMGKGTTVPGDFDVDLIIFSRSLDLSGIGEITSYKNIMNEYNQFLRSRLRAGRYVTKGINDHSLQFKYCNIGVDLLLSPYFESKQQYYRFLERIDKSKISMFSCSASKWQVEFVQSYPNIVLEYIKRAKAWRNNAWDDDESRRPSSYLMELLVIKAYENGGYSDSSIIKQQLVQLVRNKQIEVYWTNNYPANEIWKHNGRSPPYIIDPANPSNNLYLSGITKGHTYYSDGDWGKFRSRISSLNLSERGY